ncbi:hypothetical protein OSB04_012714 [Centaurea solstitialis]|uniref:Uncharacterized protein n=1 Tax=Centaurea solstitialis TaxID=347529 RepID=A0AA38TNK7_9ASTR|nr:hypothetical protein OSB04_012714 [Centaurea solstitialis]
MNGDIELHFVPTEYQLADLFTKPLDVTRFNMLLSELGMMAATTSTSLDAQLSSEATPLQATESLPIVIPQHDVQFKQNNVVGLFDIPEDKDYLLPAKEFLLNSPLKTAFTLDPKPNKPMLQQLWSTATVAKEKNTKGVLREERAQLPKKKRLPPVPTADEIVEFLDAIGYRWPVNKEGVLLPKTGATVHKSGLNAAFYYIWNTFGLCLSGKTGSTEQFPTVIQQMVFSAIKNREFDYARSIWDDMVRKVRSKNRVANVAFTRFFSAVLELHMGENYPKVGNSNNYALGPRFLDQVAHHPDDVPLSDVLVVPEPAQDQDQEDAEPSTAPTAGTFSIISSKPHSSTSMHAMSVANPILTSPAATTSSALQKRPQPSSATPPPPPKRAKARAQKKKTQAADTSTSAPVTQEPEVVQLEPSENLVGNHSDTLQASGNISKQYITVTSSMKANESSSAHLATLSTGSLGAGSEGHQDDPFNDFILTDAEHQLNTAELRRQSAERNLLEARTALQQKEAEHSAQLQSLQQELVAAKAAAAAAEAAAASATAAAVAATPPPTAVTLSIPCLDNIHDKVSQVASSSTNLQASIDDLKATAFPALSTNIINSTNSLTTFQTTVVQRLDAQEAALRAIQEQVQGLSSAVNALTSAPAPPPSFTTADREVLQSLISSSFIQRKVISDMASLLQRSVTTAALVQAPAEGERQPRDHSAYSPSTNWRTTEDGGNNEDDDDDDEDDDDVDDDIFVEKEEYNEAVQAQLEHNKKQKEAFLSAQAARRLASDFVDEDAEISADPILAQKAVLKVFNKNAEIQTGEVNAELDWCRDRLHLRKHGAAISGIHLRRSRGKKGNPGKTWITVKRSGVKDVEHTLDKLDRYNLSEWNEIRSLLPKANKNYRAEVEEVIEGLIARIRRTTEIPDDLLQHSSVLSQQPVRRSAGTSTRRPTPCLPRMVVKPLDLSMLDLSFPPGISLSEGQVIREPVHGICVSNNSILRFQRFSELHIAPYEHLLTVLFTAQQDKKNPDNKEIIRTIRAILDHRLAFSDTPVPVCVKTEYISEESDNQDQDQETNESVLQSSDSVQLK